MGKQEKAMIGHRARWKDWSQVEGRSALLFMKKKVSKWRGR